MERLARARLGTHRTEGPDAWPPVYYDNSSKRLALSKSEEFLYNADIPLRAISIKAVELNGIFKATKDVAWPLIRAAALEGVLLEVDDTAEAQAAARRSVKALAMESEANTYDREIEAERKRKRVDHKRVQNSPVEKCTGGLTMKYGRRRHNECDDQERIAFLNHRQVFEHDFKTKCFNAFYATYPNRDLHLGTKTINPGIIGLVENIALASSEHISVLQGVASSSFFGDIPFACYISILIFLVTGGQSHFVCFWRRFSPDAMSSTGCAKLISHMATMRDFTLSDRKTEAGMFLLRLAMDICYAMCQTILL